MPEKRNVTLSEDRFEVVDHTADWALKVRGTDLPALFTHAAAGMSELLTGKLNMPPLDVVRELHVEAYDVEGLLVEWLSELAYWAETEGLVFCQFAITEISPTGLQAVVKGGRVKQLHKHIKAVTYHNLAIDEASDGLEVTIVFDV